MSRIALDLLRPRLWPRPTPAIGLELSSERINLVQFDPSDPSADRHLPRVRAAASLALPLPREELLAAPVAFKALMRDALRGSRFKGRRVVSCLPAADLRIFPISIALPPGQDEAPALAADLRQRLGAELDSAVVDYLPIRSDEVETSRREALVAVAARERVVAYLHALEGAGLDVQALDIGPAALARLIARVNQVDARAPYPNVLAINFGRTRSHLSVIWGRRLVLDREIEFAEQPLLERVVRALGVDATMARRLLLEKGLQPDPSAGGAEAEMARTLAEVLRPDFAALVAEINKTLIYTASRSRGRSVDQIYMLGSVARYPGASRLMQSTLSIPVQPLNPFHAFRSPLDDAALSRLEPIAGIALACGLALRGWGEHA